jgi:hypothetical protein
MKNSIDDYKLAGGRAARSYKQKDMELYEVTMNWYNESLKLEIGENDLITAITSFNEGFRNAQY